MKCGPNEHPCKECGLPTAKNLELCNLCEGTRVHQAVQMFMCGGQCKDGQDHNWDGPDQETVEPNGASTSSVTCSKCGLAHIDWCLMNAP
jgi:hypothetical protein